MSLPYKEPGLAELIDALDELDAAEEECIRVGKLCKDKVKAARTKARAVRLAAAGREPQQLDLATDAKAAAVLERAREVADTARHHGIELQPESP